MWKYAGELRVGDVFQVRLLIPWTRRIGPAAFA